MESIDDDGWVLLLFVGMLDLAAKLEHSRMLRRQLSNSGEGDNAGTSFSGGSFGGSERAGGRSQLSTAAHYPGGVRVERAF